MAVGDQLLWLRGTLMIPNKTDTANKIYSFITPEPVGTSTTYIQQTQKEPINLLRSVPLIQFTGCSIITVNFINKQNV